VRVEAAVKWIIYHEREIQAIEAFPGQVITGCRNPADRRMAWSGVAEGPLHAVCAQVNRVHLRARVGRLWPPQRVGSRRSMAAMERNAL